MASSNHGPDSDETQPLPLRQPLRHPVPEASPTDLLGRYRVVGEAGKGGMGTVCEAVDTLLGRRVAIKFLNRFVGDSARERMIHEARAMAGLQHRSICRVLEVVLNPPAGTDQVSWRPFMVMEWIAGPTLDSAWPQLSIEKRLSSFEQVVEAVASMHAAGIVHRDLKPANILLDRENIPVVVDFGLSARGGDGDAPGGTFGWSAPEQFEAHAEVGPSADVFALGVLLYNLLTGVLPFDAPTAREVLRRAREGDVQLPEAIVPDIAPPLQRIALAAIDPDPAQRYADAAAMLADLRRFRAGDTVLARPRQIYTRFSDEVERHLSDAERWRKQGLASEQEVRPIIDGLRVLQRPESPWVLDSRRLSASQVSLYLGGWLIILALTVGVWNTADLWREKGASLPWLVPAILAVIVTAIGLRLAAVGEQRPALGFLFTSALAVPTVLWQFMRTVGWLEAPTGERNLIAASEVGLANNQQLALSITGLALGLVYRFRTPSTAFTLVATLFALWAVFAVGLRYFDYDTAERLVFGQMSVWMLIPCAVLLLAGVVFDGWSNRPVRDPLVIAGPRDGGPVLVTALVGLVAMLVTLAVQVPEWYWFGREMQDERGVVLGADPEHRAIAFLMLGAGLFGLSSWFRVRPTSLRDWCARALRWFVPSFVLIPMVWLEVEGSRPGWEFWLLLLAIASVGFVAASSILQWRPFLVSGLLGTADLVVRGFYRLERDFEGSPMVRLGIMLGLAVVGLLVMFLASYPERAARRSQDMLRVFTKQFSHKG
ncbi:MAG: Serine/threonine-protein kinase PknB [Planctomycetota bacterium]|jgi:serine/threonine protein kinase